MTSESIFYILGVILGAILGYAVRHLVEPDPTIWIEVRTDEEGEDSHEQG